MNNSQQVIPDSKSERVLWVDALRGFCMLAILWFHSEMYYLGCDRLPYALYVGTVLAAFFFLSGYVSYKPHTSFSLRRRLYSVWRTLVVPYFVFCGLIVLAKPLVHHDTADVSNAMVSLITGQASWFITALVVAQLLFVVLMRLTSGATLPLVGSIAALLVAAHYVGNSLSDSPLYNGRFNLWHINEALPGLAFMLMGYLFHRYEALTRSRRCVWLLAALLLSIFTKYALVAHHLHAVLGPVTADCYPLFVVDLCFSVLLLVLLFRRLPSPAALRWIGRHSLVCYFFCGGCPMVSTLLLHSIGLTAADHPHLVVVVFILSVASSSLIAWAVYRYLPWLVTRRKATPSP